MGSRAAGFQAHSRVVRSKAKAPIPLAASASRRLCSRADRSLDGPPAFSLSSFMPVSIGGASKNGLCIGHRAQFTERNVARQVIAPGSRAGRDKLAWVDSSGSADSFAESWTGTIIGSAELGRQQVSPG